MKKQQKANKGFTLVEIIVVLVILAILAAVSIPSMIGFVNDSRGKAYITEARAAYVAAQSYATEHIAGAGETAADVQDALAGDVATGKLKDTMEGSYTTGAKIDSVTIDDKGKVTGIQYTAGGYTVTIESGKSAVVTKE